MRKIRFAEGEFYHLYNRGVDKRIVFASKEDYDRFQAYLYLLNDEKNIYPANFFFGARKEEIFKEHRRSQIVAIGAYCLMPNHFHLLVTPLVENGISTFMQRVLTAYTMYFNEKYQRTGSLFEGTFKATHVDRDEYLKYLYAYIHLNPSKLFNERWKEINHTDLTVLALKVAEYQYSSIGEYMNSKFLITSPKHFPKYFASAKDMTTSLNFWLKYREEFVDGGI